jgi:hypothetical protein
MQSRTGHGHEHAFTSFYGRQAEGLTLRSRRGMIKAGFAGLAGLSLPTVLKAREEAAKSGKSLTRNKSVILLWMAGGPSHMGSQA